MLAEAIRSRRFPGIGYLDGARGRQPVLVGTELEVWRLVDASRRGAEALEAIRVRYPWLSNAQVDTALDFYRQYPREFDADLTADGLRRPRVVQEELALYG